MIRITPKTEEEKIEHQEKIKINLAEEALRVSKLDDDGTDTPEELPPPSPLKSETKHGYTVEILYHFTCVKCQQWWSYATTPGQPIIQSV